MTVRRAPGRFPVIASIHDYASASNVARHSCFEVVSLHLPVPAGGDSRDAVAGQTRRCQKPATDGKNAFARALSGRAARRSGNLACHAWRATRSLRKGSQAYPAANIFAGVQVDS
jgi:hypothetical protein